MKVLVIALLLAPACASHSLMSVRVTMPTAAFPISMSDYIVVDSAVTSRDDLVVVAPFERELTCVKGGATVDASDAINEELRAAGGEGLIGFAITVASTPSCQGLTLQGDIVKRRGGGR